MKIIKIDLSTVNHKRYDQMYRWCGDYINEKEYKWHHQPSRGKYWVDFITPAAASAFTFQWIL